MAGYPDTFNEISRRGRDVLFTSSTTTPANPSPGDFWVNPSKTPIEIKVFNGTSWGDFGGGAGTIDLSLYQTIAKAAADMAAEVARADGVYETKVQTASDIAAEAVKTATNLANAIAAQDTKNSGLYITAAKAATDLSNAINAAAANYVLKTDPINATTGATDADKVTKTGANGLLDRSFIPALQASAGVGSANQLVATDVNGKIDGSFLSIPGGMAYKGGIAATAGATISAPKSGDFYVISTAGTLTGFAGASGAAKVGDAMLFDGTKWDIFAAAADLATVYTKGEADAKFQTLTAAATETARVNTAIANAATTADGKYQTKTDAGTETARVNTAIAAEQTRAEAAYLKLSGGTLTGALQLPAGAPTANTEAANKKYVDDKVKAATLAALADVNVPTPNDRDHLVWDNVNKKWIAQRALNSFADMSDGNITNPANGQVLTYDISSKKWINKAPAAGVPVGAAPLDSPAFTGTPIVPTAAVGTKTTQIASTAFVDGAIAAQKLLDDLAYATKTELAGEVTRADSKYETKTDAALHQTKADAATEKTRVDTALGLKADKTYVDGNFIKTTDPINARASVADADKVVKTDATGHIDASLLSIPGGMTYKGVMDPATGATITNPKVGDFYVFNKAGTMTGFAGATDAVKIGDAALFDGTKWDVLAAGADLSLYYTKTESDGKYQTLALASTEKTRVDGLFTGLDTKYVKVSDVVNTSTGATEADKVTKLNASGKLDKSFIKELNNIEVSGSVVTAQLAANTGSFDLSAGVDFTCTPATAVTLTFTNLRKGIRGMVILDNTAASAITFGANTKKDAKAAANLSKAGIYLLSYICDGTNVLIVNSGGLV